MVEDSGNNLPKEEEKVLLRLDLGCGQNCPEGFDGVDWVPGPNVTYVHDLTKFPYPFEDNSVGEIHCSHFLEHLDGGERIKFFEELYRIMVTGAKGKFVTPYHKSTRAVQDPTHKWPPVCEAGYLYWNKKWREDNRLDHYGIKCDFDFNVLGYSFGDQKWNLKSDEAKQFAMTHYYDVIADMMVEVTKR